MPALRSVATSKYHSNLRNLHFSVSIYACTTIFDAELGTFQARLTSMWSSLAQATSCSVSTANGQPFNSHPHTRRGTRPRSADLSHCFRCSLTTPADQRISKQARTRARGTILSVSNSAYRQFVAHPGKTHLMDCYLHSAQMLHNYRIVWLL